MESSASADGNQELARRKAALVAFVEAWERSPQKPQQVVAEEVRKALRQSLHEHFEGVLAASKDEEASPASEPRADLSSQKPSKLVAPSQSPQKGIHAYGAAQRGAEQAHLYSIEEIKSLRDHATANPNTEAAVRRVLQAKGLLADQLANARHVVVPRSKQPGNGSGKGGPKKAEQQISKRNAKKSVIENGKGAPLTPPSGLHRKEQYQPKNLHKSTSDRTSTALQRNVPQESASEYSIALADDFLKSPSTPSSSASEVILSANWRIAYTADELVQVWGAPGAGFEANEQSLQLRAVLKEEGILAEDRLYGEQTTEPEEETFEASSRQAVLERVHEGVEDRDEEEEEHVKDREAGGDVGSSKVMDSGDVGSSKVIQSGRDLGSSKVTDAGDGVGSSNLTDSRGVASNTLMDPQTSPENIDLKPSRKLYSRSELLELRESPLAKQTALEVGLVPVKGAEMVLDIAGVGHKREDLVQEGPLGGEVSKEPEEEDWEEDSDDEELALSRAFSVHGNPNFDLEEPEDGYEYLRRVRWEAQQCPKVVVATNVDVQQFAPKQTPYMPEVPGIPSAPHDLLPSQQWEKEFLADFSDLRTELSHYDENYPPDLPLNPSCSLPLPVWHDGPSWKAFCFGLHETPSEPDLQDVSMLTSAESCAESAEPPAESADPPSDGTPPAGRAESAMPQAELSEPRAESKQFLADSAETGAGSLEENFERVDESVQAAGTSMSQSTDLQTSDRAQGAENVSAESAAPEWEGNLTVSEGAHRKRKEKKGLPVGPLPPLLGIIGRLDPMTSAALLRQQISWLVHMPTEESVDELRTQWLFALAARVDKPLHDTTQASLRELLRVCCSRRAKKEAKDDRELIRLNVLITVAGRYFGQGGST